MNFAKKGPGSTTRKLSEALQDADVAGLSLLDIGGGVGPVQYALIDAGIRQVTSVDAAAAYVSAARSEAERRGRAGLIHHVEQTAVWQVMVYGQA